MPADLVAVSSQCCTKLFKKAGEISTLVAVVIYRLNGMSLDDVDTERPFSHECDNFHAFMEDHASDVLGIKRKFTALRWDLRLELAQWFLSRDVAGYRFTDMNLNELETKYSKALVGAQHDYGELMYPKKARMCNHCGVLQSEEQH
jgi:hypothetical protein